MFAVLLFTILSFCCQGCHGFQWSLSGLADRSQSYACSGSNVTLPWDFTLGAGERVIDTEWYFQRAGGVREVLGNVVGGHFFTSDPRVQHVPPAGLRLRPLGVKDAGRYTVTVNVLRAGGFSAYTRSAEVILVIPPVISNRLMEARLGSEAVWDLTTLTWHVPLLCGEVISLGQPPMDVLWTDPSGLTTNSSGLLHDGSFVLGLNASAETGRYSCHLDDRRPEVNRCFDPLLLHRADLLVDRRDVIITVQEAELNQLNVRLEENENRTKALEQSLQDQHSLNETGLAEMLQQQHQNDTERWAELQQECLNRTMQLERVQQENREMAQQLEQLQQENQNQTIELEQLRQEEEQLRDFQENQNQTTKLEELRQENQNQTIQLDQLLQEKEKLRQEVEQLRQENQNQTIEIDQLRQDEELLREENQNQTILLEQVQLERSNKSTHIELLLHHENHTETIGLDQLEQDNQTVELEQLSQEKAQLQLDNEILAKELTEMRQENQNQTKIIEELQGESQNETRQVDNPGGREGHLLTLENQVERLQAQVAELRFNQSTALAGALVCSRPRDCADVQCLDPHSGTATIFPSDATWLDVYCDQETDGGGWTVFQRRQGGQENFYRNWTDYEQGFGDTLGEFWLGLQAIHALTRDQGLDLRVDMQLQNGTETSATYRNFSVGAGSDNFRLHLGHFAGGNAGDGLSYQDGTRFATFDSMDQVLRDTCWDEIHGGWWYHHCRNSNLNGDYTDDNSSITNNSGDVSGVAWEKLGGRYYTVRFAEMKLRRKA